ncbi:hypothetical protein N7456_006577, partial [Penicillium angulare]
VPLYYITDWIRNVYFHPLSKFPGPKHMAASRSSYLYTFITGRAIASAKELHDQYGPVVRVGPGELQFIDAEAWKSIYGFRQGHQQKQKDARFYAPPLDGCPSIITSNDADHARQRRALSHAFSDKSLHSQEPIMKKYSDLLMQRLHECCETSKDPVEIVSWYNFTTFDLIGDMTFGEPFGCLENGKYHPWVSVIFDNLKSGAYMAVIKRIPGINHLLRHVTPKRLIEAKMNHMRWTRQRVDARIEKSNDRPDFFANILKHKDTNRAFSLPELYSTGNTMIVAGSETTATLLSGATYFVLMNPDIWAKVRDEVRGAFNSEDEITIDGVSKLEYLGAILTETLRIYPPVPGSLPRLVGDQGDMIAGNWVPPHTIVSVHQAAAYLSEYNFKHATDFIPERHLNDPRFASDNKDALQPFSVGPRNCIGRNLAYVEMRLVFSRMVYNFDMELADPNCNWHKQKSYIFWEKPPLKLHLTPRAGVKSM